MKVFCGFAALTGIVALLLGAVPMVTIASEGAKPPQIPAADQTEFAIAEARFQAAQAAFQASLTKEQRDMVDQMNKSSQARTSAFAKLTATCGALFVPQIGEKDIVCAPKPPETKK